MDYSKSRINNVIVRGRLNKEVMKLTNMQERCNYSNMHDPDGKVTGHISCIGGVLIKRQINTSQETRLPIKREERKSLNQS